MTEISRSANRGIDPVSLQTATILPTLTAGEALYKWDFCRIDPTDGKVYRAKSGSSVSFNYTSGSINATGYISSFAGVCPFDTASGEAVRLVRNCGGTYAASLTPGKPYWIAQTSGSLSSGSPCVNMDQPVAMSMTDKIVFVF
jgi:hypothetical protein